MPRASLGAEMTLQEQEEHEDGLHELALRSSVQDMGERLGSDRLAQVLAIELKKFGFEIVPNGKR